MRNRNHKAIALAVIALSVASALRCWATDVAVLRNGFSIRHQRRKVIGSVTRLYVSQDGVSYVDVPTADIEHFEEAPPEIPTSGPRLPASGSRLPPSGAPLPASARQGSGTLNIRPRGRFASSPAELNEVVNEASGRYRLDPDLVNSVIRAESGFNVRAVSRKGAQGLMQLMPGTASKLGVPNAFDAKANVDGGTRYLRELLERYNFDLIKALAAYNAGPERVEQYGGVPPYEETHAYVNRIVRDYNKKKIAQKDAAQAVARKSSTTKDQAAMSTRKSPAPSLPVQGKASSSPASQ